MACQKKYFVFLGIFLVNFPNGLTWYYGNMSSYTASSMRHYLGPDVDVETVWLMSVFIGFWTTGLLLGALLQKVMPRPRLIVLGGVLLFDGAFAATSWTIKQSLFLYVTSLGAFAGLADGFTCTACMAFIPMWEKERVGLATALATSGLGIGALVINQVISRFVNPHNMIASEIDGNLTLFSQDEIVTRVPSLFLLLAVFNFTFHAAGLALLKTKPPEESESDSGGYSRGRLQQRKNEETTEEQKSLLPAHETIPKILVEHNKDDGSDASQRCVETAAASSGEMSPNNGTGRRPRVRSVDSYSFAARGGGKDVRFSVGSSPSTSAAERSRRNFRFCKSSPWGSMESLLVAWPGVSDNCSNSQCGLHHKIGAYPDIRNMFSMPGSLLGWNPRPTQARRGRANTTACDGEKGEGRHDAQPIQVTPSTSGGDLANSSSVVVVAEDGEPFINSRMDSDIVTNSPGEGPTVPNQYSNSGKSENDSWFTGRETSTTNSLIRAQSTIYGSTHNIDQNIQAKNDADDVESGDCPLAGSGICFEMGTASLSPRQMVCTRMFYVLWLTQFCMDYTLSVLTNYYKLYGELYIPDDHFLAFLGTAMTATMIIPRLTWGAVLDRWGVKATFVTMTSSTVVLISFWSFTAKINRWLYSGCTLTLCWCVCAFDSLAAAAVLLAFGPEHYNLNYGVVASSSIFLNMVTPLGMKFLLDFFGWPWLFLSAGILNFMVLMQTLCCSRM